MTPYRADIIALFSEPPLQAHLPSYIRHPWEAKGPCGRYLGYEPFIQVNAEGLFVKKVVVEFYLYVTLCCHMGRRLPQNGRLSCIEACDLRKGASLPVCDACLKDDAQVQSTSSSIGISGPLISIIALSMPRPARQDTLQSGSSQRRCLMLWHTQCLETAPMRPIHYLVELPEYNAESAAQV